MPALWATSLQCNHHINLSLFYSPLNVGRSYLIAVSICCLVLGRPTVLLPEDPSSDCEDDDQTDSICKGHGISVGADPQNIKFEVFSTRIHEGKGKQCVVSNFTVANLASIKIFMACRSQHNVFRITNTKVSCNTSDQLGLFMNSP